MSREVGYCGCSSPVEANSGLCQKCSLWLTDWDPINGRSRQEPGPGFEPTKPEPSAPLDVGARATEPEGEGLFCCDHYSPEEQAEIYLRLKRASPPTDVDRRLDEVRARLREPRHYTGNDAFRARDFNDALFLLALVDELRRR